MFLKGLLAGKYTILLQNLILHMKFQNVRISPKCTIIFQFKSCGPGKAPGRLNSHINDLILGKKLRTLFLSLEVRYFGLHVGYLVYGIFNNVQILTN